jgi:hypothetical protein
MKPKVKKPSLDETYLPDETGVKLNPYDKLQSIFSENNSGELTQTAYDKIDYLLGEEKQPNKVNLFLEKLKDIFNKIDNFIFRKNSRKMNNQFYSRKKKLF